MSNVIVMTSGTSFASQANPTGVAIPLKYALPIYDYRYDPFVLSANIISPSAAEPVSASNGTIFGEIIYNVETLGGAYLYSMTPNRMLISAAGQAGTTTITGNPFNSTSYMNLMNGQPLSPVVSGSSMVYSGGSWTVASPVSRSYNGISATPTGWATRLDKYFQVVSFAPIASAAGGQARGLYKVRFGNELGTFKFNKIGLYMARYTISAGVDSSVEPVLYAIATLPNGPVIKTNDGSNITFFEADVEVLISASNYFSQVMFVNNTEFNRYAGEQAIYWDGDVAFGSSAVPGSFRGPAKVNITENNPNKPIVRLTRDNSANYINLYYNGASSTYPQLEAFGANLSATFKWNGTVSASHINASKSVTTETYYGNYVSVDEITTGYMLNLGDYAGQNVYLNGDVSAVNGHFGQRVNVGNYGVPGVVIRSNGIVSASDYVTARQQIITEGTFVGVNMNLAGVANVVGASNLDGSINTYNGLNVFRNGGGGIPQVFITSAGVISAGGNEGAIYARNIRASEYLYAAGSTVLASTLYVANEAQYQRNVFINNMLTNEPGILLTSAGVISAGGIEGFICGRSISASESFAAYAASIATDLSVNGVANIFGGSSVWNGLVTYGGFQLSTGNLTIGSGASHIQIGSANTGIYGQPASVTATGASSTTLTADCTTCFCGRVFLGPYSTAIDCVVSTTKASTTAMYLITPISSPAAASSAPDQVFSVDIGSVVNGVSFRVTAPAGSNNVYGFNFMIINKL